MGSEEIAAGPGKFKYGLTSFSGRADVGVMKMPPEAVPLRKEGTDVPAHTREAAAILIIVTGKALVAGEDESCFTWKLRTRRSAIIGEFFGRHGWKDEWVAMDRGASAVVGEWTWLHTGPAEPMKEGAEEEKRRGELTKKLIESMPVLPQVAPIYGQLTLYYSDGQAKEAMGTWLFAIVLRLKRGETDPDKVAKFRGTPVWKEKADFDPNMQMPKLPRRNP
jgi:hypothetical protein